MKYLDRIGGLVLICWVAFGVYYFQPGLTELVRPSRATKAQRFLISSGRGDIGYLTRRRLRGEKSAKLEESAGAIIQFDNNKCFVQSTFSAKLTGNGRVASFKTVFTAGRTRQSLRGRYLPERQVFEISTETESPLALDYQPRLISTLFSHRRVPQQTGFKATILDPYRAELEEIEFSHVKKGVVDVFGEKRPSNRYSFQPNGRSIDFHVSPKGDILLQELSHQTIMIAVGSDLGRANRSNIIRKGQAIPAGTCEAPLKAITIYQRLLGNRFTPSLKTQSGNTNE